jgi:hypothetical protein
VAGSAEKAKLAKLAEPQDGKTQPTKVKVVGTFHVPPT